MSDGDDTRSGPPEYYSDLVRVSANPWGFNIDFALLPIPQPGQFPQSPDDVEPIVRVRFSPSMALAIRNLLETNIAAYEEQVGKIPMPPELKSGQEPQA